MHLPASTRIASTRRVLTRIALACLGGVVLLVTGCGRSTPTDPPQPAEPGVPWFEDVTEKWGIDFVHDPGQTNARFTPQSMGSGVAVLDCDGDGLLDLYFLQFGGPDSKSVNRLYRQTVPGTFIDATEGSGLGVPGHNHGVAVGDVNNDGKPDVLLSQFRGIQLFLNQGGGKFRDVTAESGLVNLSWGVSAAFIDYDRDGWLDLFVANYVDYDATKECRTPEGVLDYCGPMKFQPTSSKLFRNRGREGKAEVVTFEDVSFASGVSKATGKGLGVTVADLTGDGWLDIFVADDGLPNRLWVNQKNGTFTEEGVSRGVAFTAMGKAYAGMGIAVGDSNNDGMLDLYVTHLNTEVNNLWRQGPRGQFRDKTVEAGLTGTKWRGTGFGTLMGDFDHDGFLDIAIVNGRVYRGGEARNTRMGFWETYAEKNQLLANDGKGGFRDISQANPALCDYWNVARGLVSADLDNDGALDLVVAPIGDRARVFRNVAPGRGHWLKVRVVDPHHNRDSYGAEVRVRAGGREYLRVVNPAESYLSSGTPILHFGLADAARVESIRVTWPDGEKLIEEFLGGPTDRLRTLTRGEGKLP